MQLNVYLSGEIHSDWRDQIIEGCKKLRLDISFSSAVTNHDASDAVGDCLGEEVKSFWRDHKSSRINAIRIKNSIEKCDLAIIRFGDKYKQWNAAYDAGYCSALGKAYITLHDESLGHALKEVDSSAYAWTTTPQQVVEISQYIVSEA